MGDNLLENRMVSGFQSNTLLVHYIEKTYFYSDERQNQVIKFSISRMKQTAVMSGVWIESISCLAKSSLYLNGIIRQIQNVDDL